MEWLERTELLLGRAKLDRLRQANVLIVGLGGVGAYAAEMICRAGTAIRSRAPRRARPRAPSQGGRPPRWRNTP